MKKIILLALSVIFFSILGSAASVGAVPGSIDFGDIQPGDSIEQKVYIRATNIDGNFSINPSTSFRRNSVIFSEDFQYRGEVSEQDFRQWVNLEQAQVNPNTVINNPDIDMENPPRVHGVFTFEMEIPNNAEPGYRMGKISLNPNITGEGTGAGAQVFGETELDYRFYVPGDAERDVVVQDVRGFRTEQDSASVEVLLSNEGSVTTSSRNFKVDLLDSRGDVVDTLSVSGLELEPGDSEWTNAVWVGGNVDEGTYQIDGEVDYFTGSAYASGSFSLGDIVTVEQAPDDSPVSDSQDSRETVPMWLVFMVLAILAVLMWSFDIEPFWILAIVGGLAISAFILLSGVSNYLLVVLLMAVGIVIYGVM